MARKRRVRYSGIGGQAVLEGVMMKNGERYAVAIRKPDGEIEVEMENYQNVLHGSPVHKIPFVRGTFNFIDSLRLGNRALNYSASFYEDENAKESGLDKALNKVSKGHGEKIMNTLVTIFALVVAIGLFMVLPYFVSNYFEKYVRSSILLNIIEGVVRIVIFLLYICGIALMKDIRRLYMYHGAEHKCINCIEHGKPLTVKNVMKSSRIHKRCGTSFMFLVMFVSIILFFFIQVEIPGVEPAINKLARLGLRLLMIPVVAGISYEIIRLAGRTNFLLIRIISAPGMLLQRLTTKEPTRDMVEVAIASVEAVFDWKQFLKDEFGRDVDAERAERTGAQGEEESEEEIRTKIAETFEEPQALNEEEEASGEAPETDDGAWDDGEDSEEFWDEEDNPEDLEAFKLKELTDDDGDEA